MIDSKHESPLPALRWPEKLAGRLPSPTSVHHQIGLLRWLIPAGLMLLVVLYELGPARWIFNRAGFSTHLLAEIVIFGTVGPALAFFLLVLLGRWLDERDTSDFQAQLLTQARDDIARSRQLNDDALQVLFSAGTLITVLKADHPELLPDKAAEIESAESALNVAMEQLRAHLQS